MREPGKKRPAFVFPAGWRPAVGKRVSRPFPDGRATDTDRSAPLPGTTVGANRRAASRGGLAASGRRFS